MVKRFDWVLAGERIGADKVCDVDLLEHSDAAVVPTLGSLVPGWLLVVPRLEALSFARLDYGVRCALFLFARELAKEAKHFGKRTFLLEHGPGEYLSQIGCGVDQAHLHVVPTDFDLLGNVLEDGDIDWKEVSPNNPWKEIGDGQEYYLISDDCSSYVGLPRCVKSQYFRRQIAHLNGDADKWNYREWPFYENARRTIQYFGSDGSDGCKGIAA